MAAAWHISQNPGVSRSLSELHCKAFCPAPVDIGIDICRSTHSLAEGTSQHMRPRRPSLKCSRRIYRPRKRVQWPLCTRPVVYHTQCQYWHRLSALCKKVSNPTCECQEGQHLLADMILLQEILTRPCKTLTFQHFENMLGCSSHIWYTGLPAT